MARGAPCWVIVAGATPTAFRATRRDDLVPTLRQLQRTQPDTQLLWFDRGRLWPSPAEARQALIARRGTKPNRDKAWRPGGDHKDPRARFELSRDQKRARFKQRTATSRRPGPKPPPRSRPPRKKPA